MIPVFTIHIVDDNLSLDSVEMNVKDLDLQVSHITAFG